MQTINGIVYRNLQEQVEQNKNDIAAWKDAAKFDIHTVGKCATADDLPSPTTYTGDYGDMYAVGTEAPYEYYIFTRPTSDMTYPYWFDAGQLQIQGDQGPQGIQGEAGPTGERGSLWSSNTSNPGATGNTKAGDQHLRTDNGDVFQFDGSAWNRTGNIRGPQGIQGDQGLQGPKGDTGETGPKGDTGDVGGFINIVATLATADLLPDPATLDNLTYAYLVGDNNELYIQIGKTSDVAVWKNMGSFNMTANHWMINDSNQLVPSNNDDVALNNLTVLGSTSLKSPSISGVTACSAIASPSTLTLSGTDGAEVLVNGTNTLTIDSNGVTLPTLSAPSDNTAYFVTMADSSGKLLKANGLSYNPSTNVLATTKVHVDEMVFDRNVTSYSSFGIMRYNDKLYIPQSSDRTIAFDQRGTSCTFFKFSDTVAEGRTITFPDKNGTVMLTTDIPDASNTLKGPTRTTSGTATPTELNTTTNSRMYYNGAVKQTITNPPKPNDLSVDFTMTTQNWDNSLWSTQVVYFQADSKFNQSGMAIRSVGVDGEILWTDKSAGGWCYLANRNTDNTFSGTNTFTGKTYVNTGIGNAKLGADYLNSESKIGYDVPLDTQEAVVYRITSCSDNDGSCELNLLTSTDGGSVYSSTIGTLCEKLGNPLTIVMNRDGVYINRNQVTTSAATRYMQIVGGASVPIIIEQII